MGCLIDMIHAPSTKINLGSENFVPLSTFWLWRPLPNCLGYAFLLFRDEVSVHHLVKVCVTEEGKLFMYVSSVTQTHKKVCARIFQSMYRDAETSSWYRFRSDHGSCPIATSSWITLSPSIPARRSSSVECHAHSKQPSWQISSTPGMGMFAMPELTAILSSSTQKVSLLEESNSHIINFSLDDINRCRKSDLQFQSEFHECRFLQILASHLWGHWQEGNHFIACLANWPWPSLWCAVIMLVKPRPVRHTPLLYIGGGQALCSGWPGLRWMPRTSLQWPLCSLLLRKHPLPSLLLRALLVCHPLCPGHSEPSLLHQGERRSSTCHQLLSVSAPSDTSIKGNLHESFSWRHQLISSPHPEKILSELIEKSGYPKVSILTLLFNPLS